MTSLRTVFQRQTVSEETGEIINDEKVQVEVKTPGEEFAFVYAAALAAVLKLDGLAVKLWVWCCLHAGAGTGDVALGEYEFAEVGKLCGAHPSSVRRGLTQLVQAKLLTRQARGRYRLNPEYAWRGPVKGRGKARKEWR